MTVTPGTAEALARLAHFQAVEPVQPDEIEAVALWILGPVGSPEDAADLWAELRDDCELLWPLVSGDWDEDDLHDVDMPIGAAYLAARTDLTGRIERVVFLARVAAQTGSAA